MPLAITWTFISAFFLHFIYHMKVWQTNLNGGESFSCCFYSHLDISRTKWHFVWKMSKLVVLTKLFSSLLLINLSLFFLCSRWDNIKLSLCLWIYHFDRNGWSQVGSFLYQTTVKAPKNSLTWWRHTLLKDSIISSVLKNMARYSLLYLVLVSSCNLFLTQLQWMTNNNTCYSRYQRFWHTNEANGSFPFVLTP